MTTPLLFDLELSCSPTHAFETWTTRASHWWPKGHTVTGDGNTAVVFEPRQGGRVFERAPDGTEHDWGRISVWDPPGRLVYTWHIGADASSETEVEIRFDPGPDGTTFVRIEHRGWAALGAAADARRTLNTQGWGALLPAFRAGCTASTPGT
ncbi:MAG: SRPBCC domain-containing protein [Acidimicrobiia bacterium]|nr:SRPBCC domain-containing protein [Acidimicrobiia bacterium]MDH4307420.1 SRPBCC domain-containing protein [Acidimicrobiia bacterium]